MTTIRRITVSQIDGNSADSTDVNEVRPFGETAFYLDTSGNTDKLALMMFDGVRTHQKSKILSPGVLYGSNADSGDGIGYDTIKLIPDATLHYNFGNYSNHQHLIIDPTAPNHIHIRAGGPIDNSNADLFLGGELTHVKVSDNQDNVVIRTSIVGEGISSTDWVFGYDGALTLPSGSPILFGNGNSRIQAGMGFHINSEEGISLEAVNIADPLNPITKNWTFGSTGQMTFPQGTVLAELVSGPTNAFGIFANGVPGRTALIRTQPSSAGFNYDWEFGNNGILTLPNTGKVAVTGVTATYLADRETAYNDSQGMYFDAVFQWARIDNSFSPIWFNLPGRLAYDQIIAWTPPAGVTPVPANIVVLANACKMNYAVWQEAITDSKLTVKSDTVDWEFDSAGKLTLPQGGVIAGGETIAIQAAYTAWQEEEAGWQAVITTGGADLNIRPWNFAGPSPEEKLATVTAMWMEQQRPGTILDWIPITASHYNEARAWLSVTSNTDGYRLWKKLTTGVTITADEKSWAFTNDGILTLPGNIVKLEVDDDEASGGLVVSVDTGVPGYTSLYKFGRSGQFTSRAISVTDTNGVRVGGLTGDSLGPILGATIGKEIWVSTNGMHVWRFTADRNFVLPPGGDILDSNGTSVLGSRVVNVPVSSIGASGDKQGDIAFNGSHMYYCTQDFASEPYSTTIVATYSGFNPDIVKGSIPQPQAGWAFTHNGTTYTLASNAVENNPGEWNCELTTSISVTAGDTVTVGPVFSADIWKRIAWSADTW